MSKRLEELKKGCGRKFQWLSYLDDFRICGRIEDLKHSEHIILCERCRARIDEREKMEKEVDNILGNNYEIEFKAGNWSAQRVINIIRKELGLSEDTKQ